MHQWKLLHNNPWTQTHHWDQLWNLPGDLKRKFELAPSWQQCTHPLIPENHKVCDMVIVPHLSLLQDLPLI
jgi:hypothetical protein